MFTNETFTAISRQGYFIKLTESASAADQPYRHQFCGENHWCGAQCPNCDLPLTLYLDIDCRDSRIFPFPMPVDRLPLLYCWRCGITQDRFFYTVTPQQGVEIIAYSQEDVGKDCPYADYPLYFPASAIELRAITPEEQQFICEFNRFCPDSFYPENNEPFERRVRENDEKAIYQHQIGGEPISTVALEAWEMACPHCGEEMPYLASFSDECLDPRGFADTCDAQVMFRYCWKCHVVGAFAQAS